MIQSDVSLKAYNTFGLEAKAKLFSTFQSVNTLIELLKQTEVKSAKKLVLGGGSNLLLTQNFDGIALKNEIKGIDIVKETDTHVWVKAGAGEVWNDLVQFAISHNFGGIENLSLIPGSVGAAPMQNIGAYGVEIKDTFDSLEAVNISELSTQTFTNSDCKFSYRESVFKRALKGQYIIVNVTFKLNKHPQINTSYGAIQTQLQANGITHPTIKDVSEAVIHIRQSKLPDPKKIGNSGSFFKNPVISKEQFNQLIQQHPNISHYPVSDTEEKIAAGWLIDQAGWKGKTFDTYGVHKNQALVLVNYGGARGQDIFELSEKIIQDIKNKFNIQLEREVNVI